VCKFDNFVRDNRSGNCAKDTPLVIPEKPVFFQPFDMLTNIISGWFCLYFNKNNKIAVF
jgi:hypothetical protein